jgi:L-ascorbate metabolism protein UlaG (beta-lactamase superfamily)
MAINITWYGHATWLVDTGDHKILVDPFLDDNPAAPVKAADVQADTILVSHGHFDHIADAAAIAKSSGAAVVAIFEIARWLTDQQGLENVTGMNIGGQYAMSWGTVRMVPAIHSSQLPDGSYGGEPAGFVLTIGEKKIYFACDTALFSDMQLIGRLGIDLAVLPIGDLFTMGPDDAVQAARLVQAAEVLPAHYNTWPPIEQDAAAWARQIQESTDSRAFVLQPGETHTL